MALNDAFGDGMLTGRRAGLEALQAGDQVTELCQVPGARLCQTRSQ